MYLGELILRDHELFYKRLQARQKKVVNGSILTKWAVLNAATEARKRLKATRSMNKMNREQLNQLDGLADLLAANMSV